jgi:hypothetical protein
MNYEKWTVKVWTAFIWLMVQWWTLVNIIKNIPVPVSCGEVLDWL